MARGTILIIKYFYSDFFMSCMAHTESPHGGIVVYSIFYTRKDTEIIWKSAG